MNFSFANQKVLLFAGLMLGLLPLAQAQSAGPGQPILFSSPDGEAVTNSILPVAPALESQSSANLPAGAPISVFNNQQPSGAILPDPAPPAISRGDARNSTDERKNWGLLTPAEIMSATTPEKIFGLQERDASGEQKSLSPEERFAERQIQAEGGNTNHFSSGESRWSKILSVNGMDGNGFDSGGGVENPSSILNKFFGSAPENNLFGDQNENANGSTAFAPPLQPLQNSAHQSEMERFQQLLESSSVSAPPSAGANFFQKFSADSVFGPSLNSQPPLALPQASSLETPPQLPLLPSVSSQNNDSTQPVAPSWAPKPAPWLSPVPPLGTMPQRKF